MPVTETTDVNKPPGKKAAESACPRWNALPHLLIAPRDEDTCRNSADSSAPCSGLKGQYLVSPPCQKVGVVAKPSPTSAVTWPMASTRAGETGGPNLIMARH